MPKKINIYDAANPARKKAIRIIEEIIEPLLKKEINNLKYYELEDKITFIINN